MATATGSAALHDPQLLKGVLTLVLLRLLAERESYGYELVVRIHRAGLTEVAEGTVYPALARLERERRVSSRLVPSSSGPARKYYRLTPTGHQALTAATTAWQRLAGIVAPLVAPPVPAEPASPEES
jgi:PadR family transcriptional regulator, regulatory protein PadR